MNIYIAGSYPARLQLADIASLIESRTPNRVTSRWLKGEHETRGRIDCALEDLQDIDNAQVVMLFSEHTGSRGGRWVELGYALGKGKTVVIIGPHASVFTSLCPRYDNWLQFFQTNDGKIHV